MTTCARCGRCLTPPRTFQRTIYRPGEICQFDLWEPRGGDPGRARPDPHGLGRDRVLGLLARGRRRADLLQGDRRTCCSGSAAVCGGWARCRRRWSGTARPGCTPAAAARPRRSPRSAAQLRVDWHFCDARRSAGQGRASSGCRTSPSAASSRAGSFANELDYQLQLDGWFDERANPRMHKTLRGRPIDRLIEERAGDGAAAARSRRTPTGAGCCASRRTPTCASTPTTTASTPRLVGRRVEARVTDREVLAVALDTGELACRHAAVVRQASDDHRARARPHAQGPAPRAPRPRRAARSRSARWPPMTR